MMLDMLFLDEDDDQGRTKLDRPLKEGLELLAMEQETMKLLFAARNRDHGETLSSILAILADPTVTSIRVVAERTDIEYGVSFERDARRN